MKVGGRQEMAIRCNCPQPLASKCLELRVCCAMDRSIRVVFWKRRSAVETLVEWLRREC